MKVTITCEGSPKELAEFTKNVLPSVDRQDVHEMIKSHIERVNHNLYERANKALSETAGREF